MLFGLFRRKRSVKDSSTAKDKVAGRIVQVIDGIQSKWALFMGRHWEKLSLVWKKRVLVSFCVITGGYSVFIAVDSLVRPPKNMISVTSIRKPQYITQSGDESLSIPAIIISEKEHQRIVRFKRYLDSLQLTPSGKKSYDSLLKARPGLMDSVQQMELIFKKQTSNYAK